MSRDQISDLAIVGAGPAGSTAAVVALKAGLSVVQLDRAKFPRQKPCGGGLTAKAFSALQHEITPVIRRQSNIFEYNLWGEAQHQLTFHSAFLSFVVRREFDDYLVCQNRRYPHLTFLDQESVVDIRYDGVFHLTTPRRTIHARQLVGADGAKGIVNRLFRIVEVKSLAYAVEVNLKNDVASAEQTLVPCVDLCAVERGYGWVFPKDDQWSVGLYTLTRGIRDLKIQLVRYIETKGLCVVGDPLATFEAHPIPVGGYTINPPSAPVYVTGDAGGFADALFGEGIYYALESGRLAGEVAVAVAGGYGSYRDYYVALHKSVLRDTYITYWLAQMVYDSRHTRPWKLGKRLLQRLVGDGYYRGATLTQSLTGFWKYLPLSLLDFHLQTHT